MSVENAVPERNIENFSPATEIQNAVVRYSGKSASPYTLIHTGGSYTFHQVPSGVLYPDTVSVLANGIVIDLDQLRHEFSMLEYFRIPIGPNRLRLSEFCNIRMPVQIRNDELQERRFRHGDMPDVSSGERKTILLGDLMHLDEESVRRKLRQMLDGENMALTQIFHQDPVSEADTLCWCRDQANCLSPYICNTQYFLREIKQRGGQILTESELGSPPGMNVYNHEKIRGVCYETA